MRAASTRRDVHTAGKARAGGRGQCRRVSGGEGPARREEEEGGQQGQGSVQREVGDGRCGSVGGG